MSEDISARSAFNNRVYTPLSDALAALQQRKGSAEIRKSVRALLGEAGIPSVLVGGAKTPAVLFRQVCSPNFETLRFISLCDLANLTPVVFEYVSDKYVTANPEKYALGKMSFYEGRGKRGGLKLQRIKVVDLQTQNGKRIDEVRTLSGESLVSLHHRLFAPYEERFGVVRTDASSWFAQAGNSAQAYYEAFLALFIQDAVLFENFLTDSYEKEFVAQVFSPAFDQVVRRTGHTPLIVPLAPTELEEDEFWRCYPIELRKKIEDRVV